MLSKEELIQITIEAGFQVVKKDANSAPMYVDNEGNKQPIDDKAPFMFDALKQRAKQKVIDFSKETRANLNGNATKEQIGGRLLNVQILALLDSGVDFENLPQHYQDSVNIKVEGDPRFGGDKENLFKFWRKLQGFSMVADTWVSVLENNTLTAIGGAETGDQLEAIIDDATQQAAVKLAELDKLKQG